VAKGTRLLNESLSNLDENFLRKLCDDQCPESSTLDFKRELPRNGEGDKNELLKDVCALANADGGDLVYGIAEVNGAASELIVITNEDVDAVKQRISQVLDGLEPRVQGIRLQEVYVTGGYVLIIRVPASFDGPHCTYNNNKQRRFVMRNGTSTSDLSYDQLRLAFDRTASLAEQARRFISDRLQLIIDKKTPKLLKFGSLLVMHLVPIAGFAGKKTVDLNALYLNEYPKFKGSNWSTPDRAFNLDGLSIFDRSIECCGYSHIFRTGAIESICYGGESVVFSQPMSKFFHDMSNLLIKQAADWDFTGPAVLSIAVLNVEECKLRVGKEIFNMDSHAIVDRPHLIIPPVWLENIEPTKIDLVLRPILDNLWQAFGEERCLDFDPSTGDFRLRPG
jgi:hypothetical protein